MKLFDRNTWLIWVAVTLSWQLACTMFTVIGVSYFRTMTSIVGLEVTAENQAVIDYINSPYPHIESVIFGLLFGTVYYIIYWITEQIGLRSRSVGRIILVHAALYILAFLVVLLMVSYLMVKLNFFPFRDYGHFWEIIGDNHAIMIGFLIYLLTVILLVNSFLEIRKKFGPGQLWKLLIGKYRIPAIEDHIFMFLDLKDSTGYAERLGHIKYSQLIQDCFDYLNKLTDKHEAHIYQYVGDEAVLTWNSQSRHAVHNCLTMFFAFQKLLNDKGDIFNKHYGFVPEFKAGVNEGSVTVAEIGNIKREIAYHGDVLNTGARIQGMCNKYGKKLLVSETLAERMDDGMAFEKEFIDNLTLRGKSTAINVYSVKPR